MQEGPPHSPLPHFSPALLSLLENLHPIQGQGLGEGRGVPLKGQRPGEGAGVAQHGRQMWTAEKVRPLGPRLLRIKTV